MKDKRKHTRLDFNKDWQFTESFAEWPEDLRDENPHMAPVILPHTWNADDMGLGTTDPYVGPGWYRKVFTAPSLKPEQRLLLETEGATNCHKVWVNDGYAGGRNGGFLPTLMDITDMIKDGENTVLVRADNSYELTAVMPRGIDWNRYGGISRPVWLHVREHAYLACAGIEIRTPSVSPKAAKTVVKTSLEETRIDGATLAVRHTLMNPDGDFISETKTSISTRYSLTNTCETELPTVEGPELWSDETPALYTLLTEILENGRLIDQREERIGFRFFSFDADEGFFLNGKPTKLRGANIHIFFPGLGNALPERFHRSDMELIKSMGCNFLRTSHYPRPKACLDACDEHGILVMEEQPYWHGSVRASNGEAAIDNVPRTICDMVRHHGNHPCIIAWNTVNEVMLAPAYKPGVGHLEPNDPRREAWKINPREYPYIRRHLQKMVDAFKDADPSRPVSVVIGGRWQANDDAGLTSVADIVAFNGGAMGLPKEEERFIGPKTGKRYEFLPDYYHDIYPDRVQLMSEGVLNDVDQINARGDWAAEQPAWRRNAQYWSIMNRRQWFCGGSMWCFTDYTANGLMRLHGAVDPYRLPKDVFYFYAAMWSDRPVLHIPGHWNYNTGDKREVVVFTNCSDIELTLNGKELGPGTSSAAEYPALDHPPLVWTDVPFEAGELKAVGSFDGSEVADVRRTAGTPAKVELRASNEDLLADGRDIAYIDVAACDTAGNRCYMDSSMVTISVTGEATLAGPSERALSGGLLRFAIRSNGNTGQITIVVSGSTLAAAVLTLNTTRIL